MWRIQSGLDVMVNHALDSVFQHGSVEIDQQSDSEVKQSQVGEKLRLIDRMEALLCISAQPLLSYRPPNQL
jgi:hypothetical protein